MTFAGARNRITVNLLLALVMSLIVNFSYLVFFFTMPFEEMEKRMHLQALSPSIYLILQVGYYFLLIFLLISIATGKLVSSRGKQLTYSQKMVICVVLTFILYFLTPNVNRNGELHIILFGRRLFNPMVTLKCSFSMVVALLYGKIYDLLYQKQNIAIENEQLKSENLQSRYNMLMSQINPHFFFNSLNSLAMLIREQKNSKALEYIDELSDTFRYIIHNGQSGLTTLGEELRFVDAYKYLLEMRYADKLFFEIEVDQKYADYKLPALSLQPLIENAVKHNTITVQKPLRVSIRIVDGALVVSNRIYPKLIGEDGMGIGLNNLSSRYKLLTDNDIRIVNDGINFTITLPLVSSSNI